MVTKAKYNFSVKLAEEGTLLRKNINNVKRTECIPNTENEFDAKKTHLLLRNSYAKVLYLKLKGEINENGRVKLLFEQKKKYIFFIL